MQQAAGRFLEQLLRHVTVARTGLALPAAAWGLSLCASQVPSITTNPDGATCPNCQGPDGHSVASQG